MDVTEANAIVDKTISDLDDIETAIEDKGVDVADGTPTSNYDDMIKAISSGEYKKITYADIDKTDDAGIYQVVDNDIHNGWLMVTHYTVETLTDPMFGMTMIEDYVNQLYFHSNDSGEGVLEVRSGIGGGYFGEWAEIGSGGTVDLTYNPESENAQSGIAVAEAMATLPITLVESPDADGNVKDVYSLESGTYILNGKFRPFPGSTSSFSFSSGQLVAVRHGSVSTVAQVFYPPNNAIQYLDIRPDEEAELGYSFTRKDAKLVNMESVTNRVTAIDESSDDEHYPTAKAVYDAMELKRIESLDPENRKFMRDIDNGYYIMHGYFEPFPNSNYTVIMDTMCVSVAREEDGSHLMAFSPLNFKVKCYEILVDDTAEQGFVFNSWTVNLLELEQLPDKVEILENTPTLTDTATGEKYKLYVENGKLSMEVIE